MPKWPTKMLKLATCCLIFGAKKLAVLTPKQFFGVFLPIKYAGNEAFMKLTLIKDEHSSWPLTHSIPSKLLDTESSLVRGTRPLCLNKKVKILLFPMSFPIWLFIWATKGLKFSLYNFIFQIHISNIFLVFPFFQHLVMQGIQVL